MLNVKLVCLFRKFYIVSVCEKRSMKNNNKTSWPVKTDDVEHFRHPNEENKYLQNHLRDRKFVYDKSLFK